MKAQPKTVFLLLATFAASVSANVLTGTIRGKRELSAEPENPSELEEASSLDVAAVPGWDIEEHTSSPDGNSGLEEDEDYEDDEEDEDYEDGEEDEEEAEDKPKEVEESNLDEEGLDRRRRNGSSTTTRRSRRRSNRRRNSRSSRNSRNPSARRDGQRYSFSREGSGQCVDRSDRRYAWGLFNGIRSSSRCADECVGNVRSNQLRDLQGFEYISNKNECRCLFEAGALNGRNVRSRFDDSNTSGRGRGPVRRTRSRSGSTCFKLTGSRFVGMNGEYESEFDEETDEVYEMET